MRIPRPHFVKDSDLLSKIWKGKKKSEEEPAPSSNTGETPPSPTSTLPPSTHLSIKNDRDKILRNIEANKDADSNVIDTDAYDHNGEGKSSEPGGSTVKVESVTDVVEEQTEMHQEPTELPELHKAVIDDDIPKPKELPKNESAMADKSMKGTAPALHLAVEMGRIEEVRESLQQWITDPNQQVGNGPTPLHIAVEQNDLAMVQLLLSHKRIDPLRISDGMTPRQLAMSKARSEIQHALEEAEKSFHVTMPTSEMAGIKNLVVFRGGDIPPPTFGFSVPPLYGRMPYIKCADDEIRRYPYGRSGEGETSPYRVAIEQGMISDAPKEFIKEKIAFYDFDKDTMRGYFSVNGEPRKPVYRYKDWEVYQLDNGRYVIPQPTEKTCSHAAEYMVLMAHGELTLDDIRTRGELDNAESLSGRLHHQVIAHIRQKSSKELIAHNTWKIDAAEGNEESVRQLAVLINKNAPVALARADHYVVVDKISDDLKSITYWDSFHGTYLTAQLNNAFWGMWGRESPDKNNQFTVRIWGMRKDE